MNYFWISNDRFNLNFLLKRYAMLFSFRVERKWNGAMFRTNDYWLYTLSSMLWLPLLFCLLKWCIFSDFIDACLFSVWTLTLTMNYEKCATTALPCVHAFGFRSFRVVIANDKITKASTTLGSRLCGVDSLWCFVVTGVFVKQKPWHDDIIKQRRITSHINEIATKRMRVQSIQMKFALEN